MVIFHPLLLALSPPVTGAVHCRYGRGGSERRLGVALGAYDRADYQLQTKVGRTLTAGQTLDLTSSGDGLTSGIDGASSGWVDGLEVSPTGAAPHGQAMGVTHDYRYETIKCAGAHLALYLPPPPVAE